MSDLWTQARASAGPDAGGAFLPRLFHTYGSSNVCSGVRLERPWILFRRLPKGRNPVISLFLKGRPKCSECRNFANIPYAKRGKKLVWICSHCYVDLGFTNYFFQKLLRVP